MRIYFLSKYPAALYVGGAYFGRVSDFERFAELDLRDGLPVRLEAERMHPLHFFLTERLPHEPPSGIDVYRLPNGLAVYAHGYQPTDVTLEPIAQTRRGECLATVYRQGGIQLALNTPKGFFNAPLPPSFCECKLFFRQGIAILQSPSEIAIFTENGRRILLERYLSAEWQDDELILQLPLSDHLKRTAICRYRFSEECAELISYTLQQGDGNESSLLAYAFFESIRIGADFTTFLCEELISNASSVREFLGNFLSVLPTENPTECLLVYRKAERLFDVRRFAVTLEEDKITDVTG
jgi:hypothetical protein